MQGSRKTDLKLREEVAKLEEVEGIKDQVVQLRKYHFKSYERNPRLLELARQLRHWEKSRSAELERKAGRLLVHAKELNSATDVEVSAYPRTS